MSEQTIKRIPYGVANYRRIRTDNAYYVDKTHFIPLVEGVARNSLASGEGLGG